MVALLFGGLRVNSSFGTWQEAKDAEDTAKLVRAALSYSNALIDERDRTASPAPEGPADDPAVDEARNSTDTAADAFRTAATKMPDKPGLKRRLAVFDKAEPKLEELRKAAYTSKLRGVQTEEGYVQIQHPLMEFANELGLGTGNITSYGRTVYAVSLAKAAESLQRSIGTHLLVDPASPQGGKEHKLQLTAFASYRYLEGIAIGEYTSGGTPEDVRPAEQDAAALKKAAQQKIAQAKEQARGRRPAVPHPAVASTACPPRSPPAPHPSAGAEGHHLRTWFAAATGNSTCTGRSRRTSPTRP